jgi:hypothetical protein
MGKIKISPTIAMCEWHQSKDDEEFHVGYCNQVIKMTKRSVTMRTLEGKSGTVTLTTKHNNELRNHIKIIPLPCDTRQWAQLKGYEKRYYPECDNYPIAEENKWVN